MAETGSLLIKLECRACCSEFDPSRAIGTCATCGQTLFARYDLEKVDWTALRTAWAERDRTLWRFRELLPVQRTEMITSLGEGGTPEVELGELPEAPGVEVALKDDGGLPTGSFKARGMAVAVSRARELGLTDLFVPSAGNAGVALAAYAARAGLRARVYLPERTPAPMKVAVRQYGAEVIEVAGTIREAGEHARAAEASKGSFDLSTLREPYRVEGKKTMGLEIFESMDRQGLPDAILYPTGGGTGLVGMAKAFRELADLGWTERAPRLYAVQPEGCAPVVRALHAGEPRITPWADPFTIAPGLLVPAPFSSARVLEAVRSTNGDGVTVTDAEIVEAMATIARRHGVSVAPEGAAPYAALPRLVKDGRIRAGERVLLYNTGSGLPFSIADLRGQLTARSEDRAPITSAAA
jgi:threonine synthase